MPFKTLTDLPGAITDNLPEHGQKIYMAAYNHAWKGFKGAVDSRGEAIRASTAHQIAWTAVKNIYQKNIKTGKWEPKLTSV